MYIIELIPFADGSRSPLQPWDLPTLPEGYAWCPDAFYDVFYSTDPAGFVEIEVTGDTVTAMTVNQAALDAYIAAHPPMEDETVSYDAVLLDHDYRLLCLETGLTV